MHSEEQHPTSKIEHLSKPGPIPFFHSDTNPVPGNALVHPFKKTTVLVVTVELIWLLFLNMPNKSLRFRKFRRSNVRHSVVIQTNNCQSCAAFFEWRALSKVSKFLFLGYLSPTIMHLDNLFLLSTPVAQMLLTPRWVSRRKRVT